jgi:hypothetical protein
MKRNKLKVWMPALCGMLMLLTACTTSEGKTYGAAIDPKKGETVELAKVFANLKAYEGKNIIIRGETGMVCQSAGCWLMLKDGANQILVQFFTFTVRPAVGSKIRAQGVLKLQNDVPYLAADGLEIF